MDPTIWLTFAFASLVLLMIPGPTVILVASYAMAHGRRVALATALGVAAGDLVAMTASLLGLGALVLASATLFTTLKWIGAAYLIWLGVGLLRSKGSGGFETQVPARNVSARGVAWHAFAVTALNPKSIAFFIAFVPQFLSPDRPLAMQSAILIATFVGLAALNVVAYAFLADVLRSRLRQPAVARSISRVGGLVLIGMGLMTALTRRAA